MALTVSFRNFWKGFDPYAFFLPLVSSSVGCDVILVPAKSRCDLEIVNSVDESARAMRALSKLGGKLYTPLNARGRVYSSYPIPSPSSRVSIWYTGENIRPPVGLFDRTWSFEPDSKLLGNHYFPIWWLQFPELIESTSERLTAKDRLGRDLFLGELTENRNLDVSHRDKFCCAFLRYNEPGRHAVMQALGSVGRVDIYGNLGGHVVEKKLDVALEYKFIFCGENDSYPGYVTEKLFDAWGTGCVPIWLGIDQGGYINPSAYISPWDFLGPDDFIEHVNCVSDSDAMRTAIVNAPLLTSLPDLSGIKQDLNGLLIRGLT